MSPADEVTNWEIFLWALHELGGDTEVQDVEDVYLKGFELAPTRFAWRTRPDLPDYKKCAKALRDAEARRPPLLVKTGDNYGRQLTVEGQDWVKQNIGRLKRIFSLGGAVQNPRRRKPLRALADAENSDVFRAWKAGEGIPQERWRLAEFFRCLPDSPVDVWRHRLETLRSAAHAANRTGLLAFLDEIATVHTNWFRGGEVAS